MIVADSWRECLYEFIGVAALVFFGGWSCLLAAGNALDLLGVALVHSLALGICIWLGAAYGPCHFNPAVTAALVATGRLDPGRGLLLIAAQFAGSLAGAALVGLTRPGGLGGEGLGGPHLSAGHSALAGMGLEMAGTFALMFVATSLSKEGKAASHSWCIGLTVGAAILCFGPVTGTGVNPFRYIGPALLSRQVSDWYVYMLSPFVGSLAAAFAHDFLFKTPAETVTEA